MRNFVTKLRSPAVSVLSQRFQDRSKYVPHYGKKQFLKAWKSKLKESDNGKEQTGN
jgi:hypothetical protein